MLGRRDEGEPRGPTLDELLVEVWEGLAADRSARCPVCSGALEPRYGAGPAPVGARSPDRGSAPSCPPAPRGTTMTRISGTPHVPPPPPAKARVSGPVDPAAPQQT